jgi:hypothetical protein
VRLENKELHILLFYAGGLYYCIQMRQVADFLTIFYCCRRDKLETF